MDAEFGLIVKGFELEILARNKVEYYPHDLMEFNSTMTDETKVEIDFETKEELNKAVEILKRR
ncbi:hypothetical protein [Paenibacillus illinoisensis]|uniref:Uncharacterized protein n=1 Tax=Paenibacillus illinoisensis TaxID=59845 RepID=A0A2W0C6E4_9BACL|nr:hypothetical protein [Paenibacillus illinoisensis]PYY28303.1 hypothetical protein PIL02S_03454 [Paenibacillus illinoisensis]